jgi:hypothetical protein
MPNNRHVVVVRFIGSARARSAVHKPRRAAAAAQRAEGRDVADGPAPARPHALAHDAHYAALIDGYADRHLVPPGITGWAQVNGHRGETDTLAKMQRCIDHDLAYLSRTIGVVRPQNPGAGGPHRLAGSQRVLGPT